MSDCSQPVISEGASVALAAIIRSGPAMARFADNTNWISITGYKNDKSEEFHTWASLASESMYSTRNG